MKSDILSTVGCVLCALFCVFLFQQDLNATFTRHGETPIGTITFKYNLAQRRFIDRLVWDRLRNDAFLYNGDIIRTADMSEAVITFNFGDIVELHSNTIVQIFADHTGVRIDFARGGISVVSASENGVIVTSGDKRVAIDPGAVIRAFSAREGALNLSVNEGQAVLESLFGTGSPVSLDAGSAIKYDANGRVLNDPLAVPVYPVSGAQIVTTGTSAAIPFVWNKLHYPDTAPTRLEVSYDRNFNRILFSEDISGVYHTQTIPEGMWFWRIYPTGGSPDINDGYSRLSIVRTYAPELISPYNGQDITYNRRAPSLRFQWRSSPQAQYYNLEAANNEQFRNPALNTRLRAAGTGTESFITTALTEGTWYWRITPVYSGALASGSESGQTESAQTSETASFTITRDTSLTAPVLISPSENGFVNIDTGRRDILFSWKKENEAQSYTIRISANNNMARPLIEHTTTDSLFRYGASETAITTGTWYWTVQYTGLNGELSAVSQTRMFNAIKGEMVQRLVFPPEHYTIALDFLNDTRFTWKTNLLENRFQISSTENFASLIIDEAAGAESYTLRSLTPGTYYWRIIGMADERLTASQSRRFILSASLPPPTLGSPDSGVNAQAGTIVVKRGQRVGFNWQPIQGAEYYIFRIHRGESSSGPVMESIVYDTKIDVNMDNYEDGPYTWSVQGLTRASMESSRRTGLSASQQVSVRQLRPVTIEHPRDGFQYAGLQASRTPDTARWSTPETAVNTRFVLARDQRMRDITHQFDVSSTSFTLPRLAEGTYYWIISAETEEGYDITSEPAQFRVMPVERLAAPLNRLPLDRHTITPKDIASSRAVNFSWDSVPGANGYIVSIFQGTGRTRRTVVESPVIDKTVFSLEDIRLIGRGTFTWQVEAVHVFDGEIIEQRGELVENRLTVDIPAPRQVSPRDSGILYGI